MNTKKVSEYIVNWLKTYATKASVKGFVVGISGGVDSAVTSSLCAKTGLSTLCVEMPIHQDANQVSRAKEHITQLEKRFANVSSVEVDVTSTFETLKKTLPFVESSAKLDISLANTRSRLRMTTLYYFAGLHHFLVVGTGNKVEDFGVGFYTKYGDGGVDLSPIADLMKSEIYALADFLQVPISIQKAAPTDGLFGDSRTDEEQIGASYKELEWAMNMQALHKTVQDFSGREKKVFTIYTQLNTNNQHKMTPIPVCMIPKNIKKI